MEAYGGVKLYSLRAKPRRWMEVIGQFCVPVALTLGIESQYQLNRKVGFPQSRYSNPRTSKFNPIHCTELFPIFEFEGWLRIGYTQTCFYPRLQLSRQPVSRGPLHYICSCLQRFFPSSTSNRAGCIGSKTLFPRLSVISVNSLILKRKKEWLSS
jgi:hypothetical protein